MKNAVKKVLSIMLVAVMLFGAAPLNGFVDLELFGIRASAVEETDTTISGTIGTKLSWEIDKTTKVLTIDNDGAMVSFASDDAPWRAYKDYFDSVVINEGCTNISQNAFYECDNIVSVDLPETIKTIDDYAFYCCGLLKNIIIPNNTTRLGACAFLDCDSLGKMIIPQNTTDIGSSIFAGCESLTTIKFSKGNNIDYIPHNAFSGCLKLSEINIPESVTSIGSYAFESCEKIKDITLSNCYVGFAAFQYSGVNSVDLCECTFETQHSYYPLHTYTYVSNAFMGCSNLNNVKLDSTDINRTTFYECPNIETIVITGDSNISNDAFNDCDALTTISFQCENLTIGSSSFYDCDSLNSVKFECSNISIDSYAFYSCNSLQSVTINCSSLSGYNRVYGNAFYGCDNLESVVLSVGVDYIGSESFAGCQKLDKITIYNKECNIASTAISIYSTIYGYIGSTAETFANTYGYNFVSIDTPCEHTYSNDCDTSCNICGVTRETGAHGYSDWTITKEASCNKTGLKERTCSICGDVDKEIIEMLPHADEDDDGICEVCKKQFEIKYPMHGVCGDNLTWTLSDDGVLTIEGTGAMYDFKESNYIMISDGTGTGETTTAWATTEIYWPEAETTTPTRPATTKAPQTTSWYPYPTTAAPTTTRPYDTNEPSIPHPNNDNYYGGTTSYHTTRKATTTKNSTQSTTKRAETTTSKIEESTTVPSTTRPENTTAPATTKAARVAMYAPAQTTTTTYYGDTSTTVAQSFPNKEGYITIIRWNLHFDKIKKVVIGEGVTSIGDYAFANCPQLTDVEMPDSITNIGYRAFINCSGLKEIEISENVRTVENYAFQNCSLLETLNFNAKNYKNSYYEAFYNCNIKTLNVGANVNYLPDINTYETVVFAEGATTVPNGAFSACEYLTSVILSDTITSIGENAFSDCVSLESIDIPDSVTYIGDYSFYNCIGLITFTTPSGYCDIGRYAFEYCYNLTTLNYNILSGSAYYNAFYDCNIKTLNIGPGVYSFPKFSSVETATFAEGATIVPDSAFYNCTNLKTVVLPDTITVIGNDAFSNCNSLVNFEIPDGVYYIGSYAFYNCDSLTNIEIPESVTYIVYRAFESCDSLVEITIPENIEQIDWSAFAYCYNLTTLNFNAKNCYVYSDAFYQCPIKTLNIGAKVNVLPNLRTVENATFADGATIVPDYTFSNCTELTSVTLPDSIESIGYRAFDYCTKIESIKLPKNLKTIGERAFYTCYNLKTADLPDSVIGIEKMAFDNCTSLEKIDIPDTVEYIGQYAFYGCTSVPSITIPENVSQIGYAAFGSCYALESVEFNAADCTIESRDIFYGCDNILFVKIGSKVTIIPALFMKDKAKLTSVAIPSSVKAIGASAFSGTSISSVDLPNGVETIGYKAFSNNSVAKSVAISESVVSISPYAFADMVSLEVIYFNAIDADVNRDYESFDDAMANGCSEIFTNSGSSSAGITVNFGDKVKNIPSSLFGTWDISQAPNIKMINIGSNVETIEDYAFNRCVSIESVNFGEKVTSVGDSAFYQCSNLKTLTLPQGIKSIGNCAFMNCTSITELIIPEGVEQIGSSAFGSCSSVSVINYNSRNCINSRAFSACAEVKTINIGNKVEVIPAYAFTGCDNLEKVYIPDIVINIDPFAFDGCGNVAIVCKNGSYANVYAVQNGIKYVLEDNVTGTAFEIRNDMLLGYSGSAQNIVLPSDISSVGLDAFKGNSVVKSIEVPYSVSKIYSGAFANCSKLERVIIPFTVTDISSSAFTGTNAKIYCYYNSYAYNYAVANGIPYELITVTLSTNSVNIVETQSVTVDAVPSIVLASGIPLVWKSSNPAVASVDSTGKIVGNGVGKTTVGVYDINGNMLDECAVNVGEKIEVEFEEPSTDTLKYGEKLVLHINTANLPDGASVKWTTSDGSVLKISNENAKCSAHGNCVTCTVESVGNGSAEIKGTVVDKNGKPIVQAGEEFSISYKMNSKAGFFQKLIAFFKKLFGLLKTYPQAFKG